MKITNLRKIGNSLGVTFSADQVNLSRLKINDKLAVYSSNDGIVVKPITPSQSAGLKAFSTITERHNGLLKDSALNDGASL